MKKIIKKTRAEHPTVDFDLPKKRRKQYEKSKEYRQTYREQEQLDNLLKETTGRLKTIRKGSYTQAELSKKTKIGQQDIARLESGRHNPSLVTILKVTNSLGYDIAFKKRKKAKGAKQRRSCYEAKNKP